MNDFRQHFAHYQGQFIDVTDREPPLNTTWPPVVVAKEAIDAEIERLASAPVPSSGRREALIAHPLAAPNAPGLAPGIQVKLSVLKPGETSLPMRHNATEINFCIKGSGVCNVDEHTIEFGQYDVWNHPSYTSYTHANPGTELQVRLTYSNVPLLQHMQVYICEDGATPPDTNVQSAAMDEEDNADLRRNNPFGMFAVTDDGGLLMPYEVLINPPVAASKVLYFPWEKVKPELDKLEALGKQYVGRRLYMYYNPMTGRTNGITPNFFATMTIRPPGIIDRPHRHVSAAINYYFSGRGYSIVAGNRYEWKAGDLMLSAPGWAVHNHASYDDYVYELTVQDQPLNIYMESLLWQESLKHPAAVLGRERGFATNRMPG